MSVIRTWHLLGLHCPTKFPFPPFIGSPVYTHARSAVNQSGQTIKRLCISDNSSPIIVCIYVWLAGRGVFWRNFVDNFRPAKLLSKFWLHVWLNAVWFIWRISACAAFESTPGRAVISLKAAEKQTCCKTSDSIVKYDKLKLNLHVSKQQILQKQTSICWSPAHRLLGCDMKARKPRSSCA